MPTVLLFNSISEYSIRSGGLTLFLHIFITHSSVFLPVSIPAMFPLSSTPKRIIPPFEFAKATISFARDSFLTSLDLNSTEEFSPFFINPTISF
jgi:hypothetical protein